MLKGYWYTNLALSNIFELEDNINVANYVILTFIDMKNKHIIEHWRIVVILQSNTQKVKIEIMLS